MLLGVYLISITNLALFIPPILAVWRKFYAITASTFLSAVFSTIYHYSYTDIATYHYVLNGLSCEVYLNSNSTIPSSLVANTACVDLWIITWSTTLKYSLLIADYAFSQLNYIILLAHLVPNRKTDHKYELVLIVWALWAVSLGLAQVYTVQGMFTRNVMWGIPVTTIIMLFAFLFYLHEWNQDYMFRNQSVWIFYTSNFNVSLLIGSILCLVIGGIFWIVIQMIFLKYYFTIHSIWHGLSMFAEILFILSITIPDKK